VHWEYGLVVFRLMMQELLNIEFFYQKTIQTKSKLNISKKIIWGELLVLESPR
jgi:hypothetical protein